MRRVTRSMGADDNVTVRPRAPNGGRSYERKRARAMQTTAIRSSLRQEVCNCGSDCMGNLRKEGRKAVYIVKAERTKRFAGRRTHFSCHVGGGEVCKKHTNANRPHLAITRP
jgi:hypothetical protein